jgi:hypothetical protein
MVNLIDFFNQVPDYRRGQGTRHSLSKNLTIITMAILSGYNGKRAKEDFVTKNRSDLLEIFPSKNGLPGRSTLERTLNGINNDELVAIFIDWVKQTFSIETDEWIHIDGKSVGGSFTYSSGSTSTSNTGSTSNNISSCKLPAVIGVTIDQTKVVKIEHKDPTKVKQTFISVVTAFASNTKVALAQKSFRNSKESEIPAFRDVVNMLGLKGKVYTGDALHAQKETTKTIIESGNDYVLQVKGNQGKLKNQLKKTAPSTRRSKKTLTT